MAIKWAVFGKKDRLNFKKASYELERYEKKLPYF